MFLCLLEVKLGLFSFIYSDFLKKNIPLHYLFTTVDLNLNLNHTLSSRNRTEVPTPGNLGKEVWEGQEWHGKGEVLSKSSLFKFVEPTSRSFRSPSPSPLAFQITQPAPR